MTFDMKVTIGVALSTARASYLNSWLLVESYGGDNSYWAQKLREVNDAHRALRETY